MVVDTGYLAAMEENLYDGCCESTGSKKYASWWRGDF